ncbi:MAG: COG1361 S-layer family protein [Candidatus Asgardarchaeia archaeon]
MKRSKVSTFSITLILLMGLILPVFSSFVNKADAAVSIDFEIVNVVWGTPQNNPISVSPGDVNVPLTVYVRNLSNNTLRGVTGILNLSYPFKDYNTESYTAKATGQPVEQSNVLQPTGDILEMGTFTLTFNLDIDANATKGVYYYNLTINYYVNQSGFFVTGVPRVYQIAIRIHNRAPVIYSSNPAPGTVNLIIGESANFTINKCSDPDNDSLSYEWRFDDVTVLENKTSYLYTATKDDLGTHVLEFRVSDGNLTTSQTWTINVLREVKTNFTVNSQYVVIGLENEVSFKVVNTVWNGRVDISFSVPNPLVIKGNSTITYYDVQPNETLNPTFIVFVPTAAYGQTLPTQLVITYSDENGNSYTDTLSIGLIPKGYINMVVYEKLVTPNPAHPGDKISISATILNKGNVGAYFANVSIISNEVLQLTYESTSYIGDIDANSPVPFTLYAIVKQDVNNGTYPITVWFYYEDDMFESHVMNITFYLTVQSVSSNATTTSGQQLDIFTVLYEGGWTIIFGGIVVLAFAILYSRRKEKELPK